MPKSKYTAKFKIGVAKLYLSGEGSYRELSKAHGIGFATLRAWVALYREQNETGFYRGIGNKHYSKEFKRMCVEAVLRGDGSVDAIVAKHNISDRRVLRSWIQRYNANKELKDYNPKPEVYMANASRKTTLEERKEITEYCISHGKDYKGTAALYGVSYNQIYTWVKKYLTEGETGLSDRRGHHKADDEVDETERLRRENFRLKRQLEERDMAVELLKKVKEFEGM